MINKQTARDNGIKIIDSQQVLAADKSALIEGLKALLPNVINADNQLDIKALNDVLDLANTTSNNQGYELTFAGKGIARALASKPTELELQAELKQSKDFDNTQNAVIRGDNLEVLKILQANYYKKIKIIYIDPPYNTKNENFIYKDNFKQSDADLIDNFALDEEAVDFLQNVYGTRSHSGWLSFIYPRLKLARDLLTDDGVIFISIDDNEQANLRILCDEIFGEDNFIGNIAWKKTSGDNKPSFAFTHDNIIIFAKNSKSFPRVSLNSEQKKQYKNLDNDSRGDWAESDYRSKWSKDERRNLYYGIKNPNTNEEIFPDTYSNSLRVWGCEQKTHLEDVANKLIWWGVDGLSKEPKKKRFLSKHKGVNTRSVWIDAGSNDSAGIELRQLFNGEYFNNPKPVKLLKKICNIMGSNYITLDFFAGSGTTGDAVMQLNAEDGGKRKFVLVQIDEKIDKKKNTEAHKFCTDNKFDPVISSITIERLNRAGEKIKADLSKKTKDLFAKKSMPDIGYKVFSCTPKPQVIIFKDRNKRGSTLDTLINMLVATCKTLDCKITCLIENKLYQADDEIYLLANIEREVLEKYQNSKINLDGWADIDLTQYLNLDIKQNDNINVIY